MRGFIFKFQTKKIGKMPKVQSENVEIAPCVYVMSAIMVAGMHVPGLPRNLVQKKDTG